MALCTKYDAYFDQTSDSKATWTEDGCSDHDCEFCSNRPVAPELCTVNANCFSCEFYE